MTNKQIGTAFLRVIHLDIDVDALRKLLKKATIDKERGCWLLGDWSNYHYITTIHGKILAHRFTHWAFYHKIPDDLFGCHRCDRPGCINPDHVFIGTATDNRRDSIKKGRIPHAYGYRIREDFQIEQSRLGITIPLPPIQR